jgi:hypothetical protein
MTKPIKREIPDGATVCRHGEEPFNCKVCFPPPYDRDKVRKAEQEIAQAGDNRFMGHEFALDDAERVAQQIIDRQHVVGILVSSELADLIRAAMEQREAELKKDLEIADEDAEHYRVGGLEWYDMYEAAQAEAARLREGLRKYGVHGFGCFNGFKEKCTCGLDALIEGVK